MDTNTTTPMPGQEGEMPQDPTMPATPATPTPDAMPAEGTGTQDGATA